MEALKDKILKEYENGNIIVATPDGLASAKLDDLVEQPVDGLLYDLNRDEATILTFIDDPKWVNDYALSQVVRVLHKKVAELGTKSTTNTVVHIAMYSDYECNNIISVHETADSAAQACHEHRKQSRRKWMEDTRKLYEFMCTQPEMNSSVTISTIRKQRPFNTRDFWSVHEMTVLK